MRVSVDLPVYYSVNQEARAMNLSESGMRLKAKKFLTKGIILFMTIHLPEDDLKAIGEVRWSKPEDMGNFENGIEFFFIDSTYKKIIKEFINIQAKQHHNN